MRIAPLTITTSGSWLSRSNRTQGRKGDAWPVRYVDTTVVAGGDVPIEETAANQRGRLTEATASVVVAVVVAGVLAGWC